MTAQRRYKIRPVIPRQLEVLQVIQDFIAIHDYSPSFREIGAALGIHPNGVRCNLDALEAKGLIERTPGVARTLRIV